MASSCATAGDAARDLPCLPGLSRGGRDGTVRDCSGRRWTLAELQPRMIPTGDGRCRSWSRLDAFKLECLLVAMRSHKRSGLTEILKTVALLNGYPKTGNANKAYIALSNLNLSISSRSQVIIAPFI